MKPKKNPKFDLNKKSSIFFQIGLLLVLFIAWRGIEMKTYASNDPVPKTVHLKNFLDERIPIAVEIEKEKPKKKIPKNTEPKEKAKDKHEVVPDDQKLLDSLFVDKPSSPIDTTFVLGKPVEPEIETPKIPLPLIQKSPIFPGCEKMKTNVERKACLNEKIHEFINKNFDRNIASEYNLPEETIRTQVVFMLDSKGHIVDIKARGPHPRLEREAVRVIDMLPEITPGMQNGKTVNVLFSIPIIFEVK